MTCPRCSRPHSTRACSAVSSPSSVAPPRSCSPLCGAGGGPAGEPASPSHLGGAEHLALFSGTKIMATIGPSIHDVDTLCEMLEAGMVAARVVGLSCRLSHHPSRGHQAALKGTHCPLPCCCFAGPDLGSARVPPQLICVPSRSQQADPPAVCHCHRHDGARADDQGPGGVLRTRTVGLDWALWHVLWPSSSHMGVGIMSARNVTAAQGLAWAHAALCALGGR